MKKMYKMYVAPEAEMIEMQMPVVLVESPVGGSSVGVGGGTVTGDGDSEGM